MAANETATSQTERLRVLKMLEEGKINAEECAELLDALTVQAPGQAVRHRTLSRVMILAGIVLVATGFMLPWFSVNQPTGSATRNLPGMGTMGSTEVLILRLMCVVSPEEIMRQLMVGPEKGKLHQITESEIHVSFPGSTIKYGLGWGILGLSLAAGFISLALYGIRGTTQRTASLCLLALGSFLIFYLVFLAPRFVGIGLAVVIIGYGTEIAGVFERGTRLNLT